MRRLFSLIKVMLKASIQSMNSIQGVKTNRKDSKLKKFGTYILILFLAIYFLGLIYVPSRYVILEMIKLGQPSLSISLLYSVTPVMMLFFSILSIPGVFYFSKDIEDYLPLPFSAWEITLAKYITAYIQTIFTNLIIFLPIFFNYFILVKPGVSFLLTSFISLLMMPLFPLSLSLILVAVLMRFVPFLKNKNLFIYMSTGLIFIPTFFVVFAMSSFDVDADMLVVLTNTIKNMDDELFRHLNLFFPTSRMFTLATIDANFVQLFVASILSLASVFISILVIQPLYFESVIGIDEKTSKKRVLRLNEMDANTKVKSFRQSFMINDFRNILRTPTFLINYFSILVVLPIMSIIPLFTQNIGMKTLLDNLTFVSTAYHELFNQFDLALQIELPLLIGLGFGLVVANFEASSSTAISREGLYLKNYLTYPIRFSEIVHAKASLSLIISSIFSSVFILLAFVVLKPNIITLMLLVLSTALGLGIATYLAIIVDTLFPSLNWETEQQAVKGNLIQVMVIIPMMFAPLLLVGLFLLDIVWMNILIVLVLAPILLFILVKQTTKAANVNLVNRIQNI